MHKAAAIALFLSFAGLGSALGELQLSCHSTELKDGDYGHETWRGHDEHCALAIDELEKYFGEKVNAASSDCVQVSRFDTCAVYICDDYNVRQEVTYEMVWAAAEILHARHRGGGSVGGYLSLDDNDAYGRLKRRTIMVAAPDVPDPLSFKRRARQDLFGRRSQLDAATREDDTEVKALVARDHETDREVSPINNTDDLNIDLQIGWGEREWAPQSQIYSGMEHLLITWNADDTRAIARGAPYHAPNDIMIEMEYAAAQFEPIGAVNYQERAVMLNHAMGLRGNMGNPGNFIARVRRGDRGIGYILIRVYRLVRNQLVNDLCG